MPRNRTKNSSHRPPRPLQYGPVYCELCKNDIAVGDPAAWWKVPAKTGGTRWTAYCIDCHDGNVRHGGPLQ